MLRALPAPPLRLGSSRPQLPACRVALPLPPRPGLWLRSVAASSLCPLEGDRWGGNLKVQAEGTSQPCAASPAHLQHLPLFWEEKNKTNLAVLKQLSGNQIIPRTEKPINKGAAKTNTAVGAVRKC